MKTKKFLMMALIATFATASAIAGRTPANSGRTLTPEESARLIGGEANNKCCIDDPACKPENNTETPCGDLDAFHCPGAFYQFNPSSGMGRVCGQPVNPGKNCDANDPNNSNCREQYTCTFDENTERCVVDTTIASVPKRSRWLCDDNCGAGGPAD